MATFHTNDVSFDVASDFAIKTVDTFVPEPNSPNVSFTVVREPRSDGSVQEQAEQLLAMLPDNLPNVRVVARRAREIGTLAAYEARVESSVRPGAMYQRIAFVGYFDTLLVLTATSRRGDRKTCDELADQWLASVRFRKRR